MTGSLGAARIFKTRVIDNDLNPLWDETFSVDVCHHANHLRLSVTDKDCVGTFDVGGCLIDLRQLMDGEKVGRRYVGIEPLTLALPFVTLRLVPNFPHTPTKKFFSWKQETI